MNGVPYPNTALDLASGFHHRAEQEIARITAIADRMAPEYLDVYAIRGVGKPVKFKYVERVRQFLADYLAFIPQFDGMQSAFDIGVGPGLFFSLLKNVGGLTVTGCEPRNDLGELMTDFRSRLGIADYVSDARITAYEPTCIPYGVDAVVVLHPTFDDRWGFPEYRWFIDECWRKNAKRLYVRFNEGWPSSDVRAALWERTTRPLPDKRFGIMDLT